MDVTGSYTNLFWVYDSEWMPLWAQKAEVHICGLVLYFLILLMYTIAKGTLQTHSYINLWTMAKILLVIPSGIRQLAYVHLGVLPQVNRLA